MVAKNISKNFTTCIWISIWRAMALHVYWSANWRTREYHQRAGIQFCFRKFPFEFSYSDKDNW